MKISNSLEFIGFLNHPSSNENKVENMILVQDHSTSQLQFAKVEISDNHEMLEFWESSEKLENYREGRYPVREFLSVTKTEESGSSY